MSRTDSIEECAAHWLVREDEGLDPAARTEFDTWLAQSDLHRVVYLRLKCAWRRADRLAALKRPESSFVFAPHGAWDVHAAALAATLLLFCLGVGAYLEFGPPRGSYVTAVGEQQSLRLADGSSVEMNTNTRLRTKMTANHRTVILERGEAFFDVVHDPKRPFVVLAADQRIVDVGTKFSVRLDGKRVKVLVSEGRVSVDTPGEKRPGLPVVAKANDVVIANTDETLVVSKTRHSVTEDLSWRRGVLVFNQQTLAEAAEQFNRYSSKQIVVKGDARNLRIGGSFRINNIEAFAQLVHEGFGLTVREEGDSITIEN
jgi:transmembrane sensor